MDLLAYLREVVLQDSAVLMELYPKSSVWNHPVFRHPDYRPFAREVLGCIEADGRLLALRSEMTAIGTRIQEIEGRLAGGRESALRKVLAEGVQLRLANKGGLDLDLDLDTDLGLDPGCHVLLHLLYLPGPVSVEHCVGRSCRYIERRRRIIPSDSEYRGPCPLSRITQECLYTKP